MRINLHLYANYATASEIYYHGYFVTTMKWRLDLFSTTVVYVIFIACDACVLRERAESLNTLQCFKQLMTIDAQHVKR